MDVCQCLDTLRGSLGSLGYSLSRSSLPLQGALRHTGSIGGITYPRDTDRDALHGIIGSECDLRGHTGQGKARRGLRYLEVGPARARGIDRHVNLRQDFPAFQRCREQVNKKSAALTMRSPPAWISFICAPTARI